MGSDGRYTSVFLDEEASEKLAELIESKGYGANQSQVVRNLIKEADGDRRRRLSELVGEMGSLLSK